MIDFTDLYFFRLIRDDGTDVYRIARSVEELSLRFGERYMRQFPTIYKLNRFTPSHYIALMEFLKSEL